MNPAILIVDDEITTATELEETLLSMGYRVAGSAASGAEAVDMAARLKPDLVLMDIMMPGEIDGIEAAEKIRDTLGIPVVFLTAYAEEALIERAKKASPLAYIMKPFTEPQIQAAIEIALRHQEMDSEMRKANDVLEKKVRERTEALLNANKALREEMGERERAVKELEKREKELKAMAVELHEANVSLNVFLKQREHDKQKLGEKLMANTRSIVQPFLEELKKEAPDQRQLERIAAVESALDDLASSFSTVLLSRHLTLSPAELQLAYLIKRGMKSRDIARLLNLSFQTVLTYRRSLRHKLDLQNKGINLVSYLKSLL